MWNSRKSKVFAIVLLVVCCTNGFAQNEDTARDVTELKPKTTTTTTTTTTVAPSPEPTTTTTTTTEKPITTPKPTPTPTPTPTPKPTPTPTPTPTPKPSIGNWNSSCVMVQMAAQVNFTYETKDNKTATALYNLPSNASAKDEDCSPLTEQIVLEWGSEKVVNSLMLQFGKNDTKKQFSIYTIMFKIQIEGDDFPNAKENQTVNLIHNGNIFTTPEKMSYHCTREQKLNMTETIGLDAEPIGTLTLTNVQFEAFRPVNSTKFSAAKDCDASDTPDVVPIAVGIALATLILIVLIAYLIARRRSAARGYTSF